MTILSILIYVLLGVISWGLMWITISKIPDSVIDDSTVAVTFLLSLMIWPVLIILFTSWILYYLVGRFIGYRFRRMQDKADRKRAEKKAKAQGDFTHYYY